MRGVGIAGKTVMMSKAHCCLLFALLSLGLHGVAEARRDLLKVGMLRAKTGYRRCRDGNLKDLLRVVERHRDLDVIVAPECFLLPKDKPVYSAREYGAIKQKIERATSRGKALVVAGSTLWSPDGRAMRNTSLVVSGGKTLLEYDKKIDGMDNRHAQGWGFHWDRGKTEGRLRWRNLEIGLEICADHGINGGVLKRGSANKLDLQVVVASDMCLVPRHVAVKPGAYLLLNDGQSRQTIAYRQLRRGEPKPTSLWRDDPKLPTVEGKSTPLAKGLDLTEFDLSLGQREYGPETLARP